MSIDGTALASADEFLTEARTTLERALVARFGVRGGLDATADAMEYAVRHWDRVSQMQNPLGYLFTVGRTKGTRAERTSGRMTALVVDPITTDHTIDVDLQRALTLLPWEQRVAVLLVHAHGHTYASAADVMDLPVTTITNHITRGIAQLRRLLKEEDR